MLNSINADVCALVGFQWVICKIEKQVHAQSNKMNLLQLINIVTNTLFRVFVLYSNRCEAVRSVTIFSEKSSKIKELDKT